MIVEIDCSPEQLDVISDHLLLNKPLGMLPDERAWILSNINKKYHGYKIKSANLVQESGIWEIELMT